MNKLNNRNKDELIIFSKTDDFSKELELNFQSIVEEYISNKLCPELLVKSLNHRNIVDFFNICLNYDFCPDFKIIEAFTEQANESLIHQLFLKFPSLPINIQYITQVINLQMEHLSLFLVEKNKQFQKEEIILLMISQNFQNDKMAEFLINSEAACQYLFNNLDENINPLLLNTAFLSFKPNSDFSYSKNKHILDKLNKVNLINYLEEIAKEKSSAYYYNYQDRSIDYFNGLELIADDIPYTININNAPINSKLRKKSVLHNPENASNEELTELSESSKKVVTEILSRDIEFIKSFDVGLFQKLSPAQLRDAIPRNEQKEEIALYLYENMPSTYSGQLAKLINSSKLVTNNRKKSFFKEAATALRRERIDEFRLLLSDKYPLDKFIEDSFQKSKIEELENVYLDEEFTVKLNKKELISLSKTKISFRNIDITNNVFNLNENEALFLMSKLNIDFIFHNIASIEEKESFIKQLDEDGLESLINSVKPPEINNFIDLIINQSLSLNAKLSISDDILDIIFKNSERKNILLFFKINSYEFYSYLNMKDKNQEYIISDDMIKDFLVNYKNVIETCFIKNLMIRDFNLTKQIIEAYSDGTKAYSALAGQSVKITRDKKIVEQLNNLLNKCDGDFSLKVKKLQESEEIDLIEAKNLLTEAELNNVCNNKKIVINKLNLTQLDDTDILSIINISSQTIINNLLMNRRFCGYDVEFMDILNSSKLVINNAILTNQLNEDILKILKHIENSKNTQVSVDIDGEVLSIDTKFLLIKNGYTFFDRKQTFTEFCNKNLNNLSIEDLVFLDSENIITYDKETIQEILINHKDNLDILNFITTKYSKFDELYLNDFYLKYIDKENADLIKKLNIQILTDNQIKMMEIKDSLIRDGSNFEPIIIKNFSTIEKIELIKFIEEQYSEYKKLNLKSSNLTELEALYSFDIMKQELISDDASMIEKFKIPQNLQNNKKLLKNIKDLLTLKGFSFNNLFINYKNGLEAINKNFTIEFKEIFNYNDMDNIQPSANLSIFNAKIVKTLEEKLPLISNEEILKKNKQEWLQLIKTANEVGFNYLNDTFDMTLAINEGLVKLKEQALAEEDEETKAELDLSIRGLVINLSKILKMNEATHVHDRLFNLADFIKSNPSEKLNQSKFKKIEEDQKCAKDLGFQLYFPKTRGDLQFLGDENDWCVNKSRHYGDNVIKHGNILVGIVPLDKENIKENVIALAHFTKNNSNKYTLEQIRWSSKIKNERNVDAKDDFDTRKMISVISSFLKEKDK